MRLEAEIEVLAGPFASQQLTFAHLLDAAQLSGLAPDLDQIEVIQAPYGTRLRGFFGADTAAKIAVQAQPDTVILILPGALVTGQFKSDARMRHIGRFTGHITRALQ